MSYSTKLLLSGFIGVSLAALKITYQSIEFWIIMLLSAWVLHIFKEK